jgi:hypothetical protein
MTLLRSSNSALIKLSTVFFVLFIKGRLHSSPTEIPLFLSYFFRQLARAQVDLTFFIFLAIITCPLGIKLITKKAKKAKKAGKCRFKNFNL